MLKAGKEECRIMRKFTVLLFIAILPLIVSCAGVPTAREVYDRVNVIQPLVHTNSEARKIIGGREKLEYVRSPYNSADDYLPNHMKMLKMDFKCVKTGSREGWEREWAMKREWAEKGYSPTRLYSSLDLKHEMFVERLSPRNCYADTFVKKETYYFGPDYTPPVIQVEYIFDKPDDTKNRKLVVLRISNFMGEAVDIKESEEKLKAMEGKVPNDLYERALKLLYLPDGTSTAY